MERKETTTQIFQNCKEMNTQQSTNQSNLPQLLHTNQMDQATMYIRRHEEATGNNERRRETTAFIPWWVALHRSKKK
jgi:hypothetical protein